MTIVEFRQEDDLQKLKSDWNRLLPESSSDTIFLTWEWITAWWSAYGVPGELRILCAFDEAGTLCGIAPLRAQTKSRYGQTVSTFSFLGDGSNDSEYLDFIIGRGREREVMESFSQHLIRELNRGTVLTLNEIPASSQSPVVLEGMAKSGNLIWMASDTPCATVRLPQTWEAFLALLKPRFRTKVRSVLRHLETCSEVRQGFCANMNQAELLLPVLFDLHTRRWAEDGKPGVFGWDQKRKFYYELTRRLLDRQWLRFSCLEWKDQVLACQYGFVYAGVYSQLQEGYEVASEHWNLGIGLRAWTIREFLRESVHEYDFLGGVNRHKTDWGTGTKHSKRLLLAKPTYANTLFCRGPEWDTKVRNFVTGNLPESFLAARRKRLEHQRLASFRSTQTPEAAEWWIAKAAAKGYFHSPLPTLLRPFRDRYQLSLMGPRVTWKRRTECTARIFCYHRINDDRDPFFPSTTIDFFEQQMRFLARTQNVVGLPTLLNRLESGSPGTYLAITFDDGYQDNYHNAFPILQHYGLPATIFLATGSIDSREPLWFEQLAYALKTSSRGFLDIEIDIPRRLWLRNEGQRLAAYRRIFELLRALPDAQRSEYFSQLLAAAESSDTVSLRDRMLTWDQVRHMHKQGIVFGSHTVTHPFLSKIPSDRLVWELDASKSRIESELQFPVRHFAYPNGQSDDFNEAAKAAVRGAGYQAAVTTIWGPNSPSSDRLALRRGGPWESDIAIFASKLDWYQFVNA